MSTALGNLDENAAAVVAIDQKQQRETERRLLVALRRELGALVIRELDNPKTEDVLLNADGVLWVKRLGEPFREIGTMDPWAAKSAMNTIAALRDTKIDVAKPILETDLPLDGSRCEALIPPVVKNPIFALRKRSSSSPTLEDYEASGILTDKNDPRNKVRRLDTFIEQVKDKSHGDVIRIAVQEKKNIVIVGSTGSGKTTLVNAVLDAQARLAPHDRTLLIEDTPELQCRVKNHVALLSTVNFTTLDCLKACMRLLPTRIVVGEVRGGEAHTLLKAWNTGHPGGIATFHANDAIQGLTRLESLVSEAPTAIGPQQSLIAAAVDVVMFIDRDTSVEAGRKVREVIVVMGYENGRYNYLHL
jgi:type IV secretion system protein TrbB